MSVLPVRGTRAAPGRPTADAEHPLRVVHVITGLTLGGAERHVESLVRHSRHDAQVLALYRDGPVGRALRREGFRARSLEQSPERKGRAVLRTAAELRRLRPDVVHVHLLSGQGVGIPAALLARVPVIVSTEHSLMDDEIEGRALTRRLRLVYRLWERAVDGTVAVSAATARRLERWGVRPERVEVVDLGIDLDDCAFTPSGRAAVRQELALPADATVVGAIGRLDPVKRFPSLVAGLSPWLAEPGRHLVVAGTGPLRGMLAALADAAGVADRVHLVGPRSDIGPLLSAFDVLVSPSRDETFGMAVVEALANGLPVVVAQCPALEDPQLADLPVVHLPLDADDSEERLAIRAGVEHALARLGRSTAPGALRRRYDVRERVAAVDDLHSRLLDGRRREVRP